MAQYIFTMNRVGKVDPPEREILRDISLRYPGCAAVVAHDRRFLDRIATRMLAIEGDSQAVRFEGDYTDYAQDRKRLMRRTGNDVLAPRPSGRIASATGGLLNEPLP